MHGRVKVRTSEEQAEAKRREQQEKLKIYTAVTNKIFSKKANGELDDEALELTARILEKNPDFYTLWNYRREVLLKFKLEKNEEELKQQALVELDLTQNCLKAHPKSYSAWHHRCWSMEHHPDPDWKRELKLCNFFLSRDERNFHCWDYRRLCCKKCEISPEEELDYSTTMIANNFSNYSAWHYRSKLLPLLFQDVTTGTLREDVLLKEFNLIQNAAFTDPDDQSVWFYHRWLLGRSKTPLHVMNVSVFREEQTVAVLLSEPCKVNDKSLKLLMNGCAVPVKWRPVKSSLVASSIWICDVNVDQASGDSPCELSVELVEEDQVHSLSCVINGNRSYTWNNTNRANMFRSNLSAATKEVLEQELDSCEQLNELEPNCKWTIFTCVLLMRALHDNKFQSTIEDFMKKLTDVDFKRKNYYNDLGSKFAIEDTIEKLQIDETEVNLSRKNLTCLYHFDQFLLIQKIDLSFNRLTSLHALSCLISAKVIIVDKNEITSLEGIEELSKLEVVSANNNYIESIKNVELLKGCTSLQKLCLENNPIENNPEYAISLQQLPSLKFTSS